MPSLPAEELTLLRSKTPFLWLNPQLRPAALALEVVAAEQGIGVRDIEAADGLLRSWAPALARLFPELAADAGLIESPLLAFDHARAFGPEPLAGRCFVKADHALPVAGSIKARGGIFEVLTHATALATAHGLIAPGGDKLALLADEARALFAQHTVAVGSTGNLGLSIGVMASALGFRAIVHMSRDAKEWKKTRLRDRSVIVIEHEGDYAAAVAAGRAEAAQDPRSHFVDDENSLDLFLGYAVAALRLRDQLAAAGAVPSAEHPLFVYLPCGVGGAPGGITFGLKHVYGDAVRCFFAEPTASPAMLARMLSADGPASVYDIGLDNVTEADGLAVAQASERVYLLVRDVLDGLYTVSDDDLFRVLAALDERSGIRIEPSSSAAFLGLPLFHQPRCPPHLRSEAQRATHLFWTTGGAFVPAQEHERFLRKAGACGGEAATPLAALRGI